MFGLRGAERMKGPVIPASSLVGRLLLSIGRKIRPHSCGLVVNSQPYWLVKSVRRCLLHLLPMLFLGSRGRSNRSRNGQNLHGRSRRRSAHKSLPVP